MTSDKEEMLEDIEVCGNRLLWIRDMVLAGRDTLETSKNELTDVLLELASVISGIRDIPKDPT